MSKIIDDSKKFLKEVRSEMSKVTWPSWPELKGSTILVIIVSVFFAVYLFIIDNVLALVSNLL